MSNWWIDESWPGPQPLSEIEEFREVIAYVGRAYGKSFAAVSHGIQQVMQAFGTVATQATPIFKLVMDPPTAPKTGPVSDSPRSLTALRGRDRVPSDVQAIRRNQVRRGNSWRPHRPRPGNRRS